MAAAAGVDVEHQDNERVETVAAAAAGGRRSELEEGTGCEVKAILHLSECCCAPSVHSECERYVGSRVECRPERAHKPVAEEAVAVAVVVAVVAAADGDGGGGGGGGGAGSVATGEGRGRQAAGRTATTVVVGKGSPWTLSETRDRSVVRRDSGGQASGRENGEAAEAGVEDAGAGAAGQEASRATETQLADRRVRHC